MGILVVGSVALDSVETPFGKVEEALGGSAVYIALAAAYFSAPVRLVAVVGGDFPRKEMKYLEKRNIDLDGLQVVEEGKTFRWGGRYHYDLNMRDTLYTELGAFEKFDPVIPPAYKKSSYICLGNIDPVLQKKVVQSIERPRLVIGDSMNYWIRNKPNELRETLKVMDVIILNDSETRQLTDEPNLIKGAKRIIGMGPRVVIIKKGEHGAVLVTNDVIFSAPAYPLENIQDPTGAGDVFAGGFIGWLAKTDDISVENLKRAVVYGNTMASFSVEKFSVEGLDDLTPLKIQDRFREFMKLTKFDEQ
ncbi:MAG: PfkB family carbohydrate kinase [Ignavibacteriae bacterium]|nr:PfkB family carbohydrate kinase [Ignavibacteriota bacterium]